MNISFTSNNKLPSKSKKISLSNNSVVSFSRKKPNWKGLLLLCSLYLAYQFLPRISNLHTEHQVYTTYSKKYLVKA